MKISKLIADLQAVRRQHGDIEVTCTGTTLREDEARSPGGLPSDVFETTVETLIVNESHPRHGKAVRLYM